MPSSDSQFRSHWPTLQGPSVVVQIPGYVVRRATEVDIDASNHVCQRVHGHDRGGELREAIQQGSASVVEHGGRLTGYATAIAFFGHAVGETNEDLKALIGAAAGFPDPGFLLPIRNAELFRWCLEHGLRVVQTNTLMSYGLYNTPIGAFLPSILYWSRVAPLEVPAEGRDDYWGTWRARTFRPGPARVRRSCRECPSVHELGAIGVGLVSQRNELRRERLRLLAITCQLGGSGGTGEGAEAVRHPLE